MERILANTYYIQSELLVHSILANPKYNDNLRLDKYGFKGNSQFDEDGMIQEIFKRISVTHKTFIEFGAGGAECENNSIYLLKKGWKGLWIEGNKDKCNLLKQKFNGPLSDKRITIVNTIINKTNVNTIFKNNGFTGEIDLLSVDVDGNDYWIWKAINIVNPRVVIMEYNAKYAPPMEWIMAYNENHKFDKTDYMGVSIASLVKLGNKKGYKLVGCTLSGANAFFVRNDLIGDKFCKPFTAENHYHPARYYLGKNIDHINYVYSGMKPGYGKFIGENNIAYK